MTRIGGLHIHQGDDGSFSDAPEVADSIQSVQRKIRRRIHPAVLMVVRAVVLPQQVPAEVTFEITPDRVDVVGAVLNVVVLD